MVKKKNRITEITNILRKKGSTNLQELADTFGVSTATIRRDVKYLESSDQVVQTLGGGVMFREELANPMAASNFYQALEEVVRIAEYCSTLVEAKDTILLGPGVTTFLAGRIMGGLELNFRVMTSSVSLALELSKLDNIRTFILGGEIRDDYTLAADSHSFNKIQFASKLFLTVDGIDPVYGLSVFNNDTVPLLQKMMSISREIILIADSTKFGKVCFNVLDGLDKVSRIISDVKLDTKLKTALEDRGISVTLV